MEPIKCERDEEIPVRLSMEEKESLDEIMKQAEFSLESRELINQSLALVGKNENLDSSAAATKLCVVVIGTLENQTIKGSLSVMDSHYYEGHISGKLTNPFQTSGYFIMSSNKSDKGVKAAVVYSGKNRSNVECGWLLAFAYTKATGRRIYAECGLKDKFINIDWTDLVKKLNEAGLSTMAIDGETGTSLYGRIVGSATTTANTYVIKASYTD
ncbi:jasmonate-induced protein homolog [Triticum dicoccoides]|uniref:jasmonate-induced protein homolog n=1 Tax=Triticum dicoccoides TaxID=85692 RepID=UPI000E7C3324|nr:jasmonate-induced protein homolog [Triticum dicoccoides]XP_037425055.1 jasmonate-induced protein homolog [Triticum dicoccoides]XP_037425056.1 jasmonate-induced protein homolog [Triticum dicoccoides]